jgi:anti-sigma regulatory factor (Ser/Thr protein kinase)
VEVSAGPRQWSLPVTEASQVAEARRRAAALGRELAFDEAQSGALAIAVTEAGTNLVKHAKGGELLLRMLSFGAAAGVELIAIDRGPGIADLGQCLRDGYSTRGTSGTGLGAIQRQADEFEAHSLVGRGTAVLARVWAKKPGGPSEAPLPLEAGALCLPIHGESVPGDAWDLQPLAAGSRLLVADGLGHGELAAEASAAAVATLRENPGLSLPRLLEKMHAALRATRGAVAAVAELDLDNRVVRYAGVGNISAVLQGRERRQNLVSMNGTLGHTLPGVREFSYPWPEDALLVVHSDGLNTRWDLDEYPGLTARHPSLVAAVLYRDFARGRDDVTVLVVRRTEERR